MSKLIDTGTRYGNLVVLSRAKDRVYPSGRRETMWKCKCDCGGETITAESRLKSGKTRSCGCKKRQILNLEGSRFGKLTAIERSEDYITPTGRRLVTWKCQCECGNIISVFSSNLTSGNTSSCGCITHDPAKNMRDLTGSRFGWLLVIERDESYISSNGKKKAKWICQCDCGNITSVLACNLISGKIRSCGCYSREINSQRMKEQAITHGGSRTRLYRIWQGMLERCKNPKATNYKNYGGRGIRVCTEWENFEAFRDWSLSHGYNDSLSIDRRSNDDGYNEKNCRWYTPREQSNNRRNTHFLEIDGISQPVSYWCEQYGVNYNVVKSRLRNGWTPEEALELVPRKKS